MKRKVKKAIDYAKGSCDTMMRKFKAQDLPPIGKFHYHQGVFLSGMTKIYEVCGEEKYYEYMKAWVDSIIYDDGSIHSFDRSMLDDIQPGILLCYLYKKTKEKKYMTALNTLMPILKNWKRNSIGGFWHKECHPDQMWLDGLYMAGPLEAEYSQMTGEANYIDTACEQAVIMYDNMCDRASGLLYHAWDISKKIYWADPKTGLSPEIWGRALGWYVTAIADILDFLPENYARTADLRKIEKEVLEAIIRYRDEKTKMWYQVVDKGKEEGNWIETSATSLFVYAIAKAVRKEILPRKDLIYAEEAFEGTVNTLVYNGNDLLVDNVCVGTGVCDYKGYISRPTSANDLHGVGAFLLMCSEMAKIC